MSQPMLVGKLAAVCTKATGHLPMSSSLPRAVELKEIRLSFGAFPALKGINLEVQKGEKLVVLGPSGSGKSAMIRCINGLERPQSGEVRVLGENIHRNAATLRTARLRTEMIFQNFNLYSNKTVLENVTLAPRHLLKMTQEEAEATARTRLAELGVDHLASSYPFQLSGGQQQRVAIARALAKSPEILLLDEPTSALDPELVQSVLSTIERIARDGLTIICVTHELGFARRLADRAIFVDDGVIVEQGTPGDLFERPATDRLKDFLSHVRH
jgi:glutamate transport system ATP-binding protein